MAGRQIMVAQPVDSIGLCIAPGRPNPGHTRGVFDLPQQSVHNLVVEVFGGGQGFAH